LVGGRRNCSGRCVASKMSLGHDKGTLHRVHDQQRSFMKPPPKYQHAQYPHAQYEPAKSGPNVEYELPPVTPS
jgi:hypothetical protein